MILIDDNGAEYCSVCRARHSFPNLTIEGECRYCKEWESKMTTTPSPLTEEKFRNHFEDLEKKWCEHHFDTFEEAEASRREILSQKLFCFNIILPQVISAVELLKKKVIIKQREYISKNMSLDGFALEFVLNYIDEAFSIARKK